MSGVSRAIVCRLGMLLHVRAQMVNAFRELSETSNALSLTSISACVGGKVSYPMRSSGYTALLLWRE